MKFPGFLNPVRHLASDVVADVALPLTGFNHHAAQTAGGFLSGQTPEQYNASVQGLGQRLASDEIGGLTAFGGVNAARALPALWGGLGEQALMTPGEIASRQALGATIPEGAEGVSKARALGQIAGGLGKAKLAGLALAGGLGLDIASKAGKGAAAAPLDFGQSADLPANVQAALAGIQASSGTKAAKDALGKYWAGQLDKAMGTGAGGPDTLAYQAMASQLTAPYVQDLQNLGSSFNAMAGNLPATTGAPQGAANPVATLPAEYAAVFKNFLPTMGKTYQALGSAGGLASQLAPYMAQQALGSPTANMFGGLPTPTG